MGTRILLGPAWLFEKIVTMKRGGFCYGLNTLFHLLLLELGFQAKLVSGRVFDSSRNEYGPEFDHMLSLVDVAEETWPVDVGFGDFAMHPLKFVLNKLLTNMSGQFFIEEENSE